MLGNIFMMCLATISYHDIVVDTRYILLKLEENDKDREFTMFQKGKYIPDLFQDSINI